MSCENTDELRIITKYSSFPGEEPTIPISADHNDGTWLPTDLYVGEMFINVADNKAWVRGMDGIFQIGATGGSFSFTGDYVYKSTGGTYSGDVYAPTFSSIGVVTQNIEADIITATYFVGGSFIGDGSGLTGINANWLGGSVSNPSSFSSNLGLYGPVVIDGTISSTDNIVDICSDVNIGCGYGVSASYFIGDGSQLTNLPIGTYSNFYTISATLSGNEIQFNRNDLAPAYSVDLTPLLSTYSVSSLTFDGVTNELTLTYDNGNYFSALIDSFETLSVINDINANEVYANNFYGVFNGTFSNDIYTISATLSGTEGVFTRTDGVTYSLDLSSFSTGATPSLIDVLKSGNIAGSYSISSTDGNTKIYFPSAPLDPGLYIDSTDPGDFIAQLQVKKLNGVVTAHTDLNTGAGSSIDISSANGVITSASDGAYLTQIQHTGLLINVSGDAPTFAGIQYAASYSTNYTNRSLVDKEYVDNLVASNDTLAEVLANGNSTGQNWIEVDISGTGANGIRNNDPLDKDKKIEFSSDGILNEVYGNITDNLSSISLVQDNITLLSKSDTGAFPANEAFIEIYQNGNIVINNSNTLNINSEYMTIAGQSGTFTGAEYDIDYSANYTNRSLVDKEYVDSLVAGATPSLSAVLSVDNNTNNNDIILNNSTFTSTSDSIKSFGNVLADAKFSFEDLGGGAWAPIVRVDNGNAQNYLRISESETYIHNSQTDAFVNRYGQIVVGPTQLTTRVDDLMSGEGTYTDTTSLYYKIGSTNPLFVGAEYDADYSANFTSNSLVTKGWVESQLTIGLTETVGFRTDTISVDADSGMFSGITSVVSTAGITGSVLVAEDRVLIESIDDYRSKIDMTSEQIVIVGGGDLDNSKYRSEVHQLGTKKVTYYDTAIASLGYGSAEKLQIFENSESFYFDASSTGSMNLFYDYFFVGAVMDYEYEFFIRSQSASGKLMTYKIKKNGYYDGGNNFFPILPVETQKGTDDPFANGDWDIVITPTGLGDQYVFNWNFTDGYIYTISVYKKYKQKKY